MTALRKAAAEKLCGGVVEELRTLNIKTAQFCAQFRPYTREDAAHAGGNGLDEMSFLFSANAGEPLKPLGKVISGGEMSRLMLAIKARMSDVNRISTCTFDEIAAGIGGAAATTVAGKVADMSKNKQIIAGSHHAHIRALAADNFPTSKPGT